MYSVGGSDSNVVALCTWQSHFEIYYSHLFLFLSLSVSDINWSINP